MPTSHVSTDSSPSSVLLIQLPVDGLGKAAADDPRIWNSATTWRLGGNSWLLGLPGPVLAIAAMWGVNQQMEEPG